MSELRQRHILKPDDDDHLNQPSEEDTEDEIENDDEDDDVEAEEEQEESSAGISLLDIIRILVTLVIASCGLSYYMTSAESLLWGYRPWFTRWPVLMRYIEGPINLTPAELSLYNGTDPTLPIYLAINSSIFDVSANPMIYGPGGSYNFFTGKDATRAFVTGCFKEDQTPDLSAVEEMFIPIDEEDEVASLTPAQRKVRREQDVRHAKAKVHKTVSHWENFFRNHKKYYQVGRVVREDGDGKGEKPKELCEAARMARPKRKDV